MFGEVGGGATAGVAVLRRVMERHDRTGPGVEWVMTAVRDKDKDKPALVWAAVAFRKRMETGGRVGYYSALK